MYDICSVLVTLPDFTLTTELIASQDFYLRVTSVTSHSASFQWNQLPGIPDNLKPYYGYILQVTDPMPREGIEYLSMSAGTHHVTVNDLEPGANYSFILQAYRKHYDDLETTQVSTTVNVAMPGSGKFQWINSRD